MPGGVLRVGDANQGGGLIMQGDPTVLVNGRPIAFVMAQVSPHPPCGAPGGQKHCQAQVTPKAGAILVNGKPVAIWPTVDSCGHTRLTGSFDVLAG